METMIQEPETQNAPTFENVMEWEKYAHQELEDLGVLEEAEIWLSGAEIPGSWTYGRYAYAYLEAPIWLLKGGRKVREFFHG